MLVRKGVKQKPGEKSFVPKHGRRLIRNEESTLSVNPKKTSRKEGVETTESSDVWKNQGYGNVGSSQWPPIGNHQRRWGQTGRENPEMPTGMH